MDDRVGANATKYTHQVYHASASCRRRRRPLVGVSAPRAAAPRAGDVLHLRHPLRARPSPRRAHRRAAPRRQVKSSHAQVMRSLFTRSSTTSRAIAALRASRTPHRRDDDRTIGRTIRSTFTRHARRVATRDESRDVVASHGAREIVRSVDRSIVKSFGRDVGRAVFVLADDVLAVGGVGAD